MAQQFFIVAVENDVFFCTVTEHVVIVTVVYVFQAVDLSSLDASEEDKIQAMMTQSTQDYNPVQ